MADLMQSKERATTGNNKKWTVAIGGSAVILLAAAVFYQVAHPTAAYPEDGGSAKANAAKPAAEAKPKPASQYVAAVGKEKITYDDLAKECVQRYGEGVLEDLINRRIILQACAAKGIEVSEAEVHAEIQRTAKRFGLAVDQYLQMMESERNISELKYRQDIVWPMLALKKLAGEDVVITKEELEKAFTRNYGKRVRAKAIIMDNSRRAREVWEQAVKNPDEFERLVRQHSVDRNSAAMDGVIPPIARYSGSKDLEEIAFKLKPGEISPTVQLTPNQIIILKCEGMTTPAVTDIKEVESILIEELREEKTQLAVNQTFKRLKEEARVDNFVTRSSTGGKVSSSTKPKGDGAAVRQTGATSTDAPPAKKSSKNSNKAKPASDE